MVDRGSILASLHLTAKTGDAAEARGQLLLGRGGEVGGKRVRIYLGAYVWPRWRDG